MGTAAGALSKLERAQARLVADEAKAGRSRAARDAAIREALGHRENTYSVLVERTGIARATITKASRRT